MCFQQSDFTYNPRPQVVRPYASHQIPPWSYRQTWHFRSHATDRPQKYFEAVANQYVDYELNQRLCISTLLVPLIILSWIPDLKYLAPVSMVANVFMGLGLCITFSYLFDDLSSPFELPQFGRVYDLPQFFSITIFTMEVVGVVSWFSSFGYPTKRRISRFCLIQVMPLENSMATPQNFTGVTGVLSRGMAIVTCVFISLGFMGYLKYKGDTKASITLNLPSDEYLAQSVKILIGLAVLCSYNLQFFICLEIVWNALKGKSKSSQVVFEYIVRTLLTAATVFLAVAVPTIGPFLALIGAFCFSFLGLMIPALIDTVTFWDRGFGRLNWAIWKNVGMFMFGLVALVSGSYTSIVDIVNEYGKNETVVAVPIHD
ncbi:unnamed protein product [Nesidiocoris tenuis]|uniref:Amino acid transporter transmembrane domain-containing protein n=1 Tax=Nesidiocoris tenuis TaxID=355587 RepID=A0A6H5GVC1_9HEMI|nr:unnamed protein product [Nesidiocoris tenuis]